MQTVELVTLLVWRLLAAAKKPKLELVLWPAAVYICFTMLLALGCFSVCGCCRPPYSRLPCTICTGILEKREQEYILEFYIAVNVLTYFSDPGCLVNSSDKLLCSLYRSFPKLGVEGRCLPNCNTVRTLAGP